MPSLATIALLVLPLSVAGAPADLKRAPSGPFRLYAYGPGIGGAPVFSSGDLAFLGNPRLLDDPEAATVSFMTGTDNALLGTPLPDPTLSSSGGETGGAQPAWTNATFFVPGPRSASHQVGFAPAAPAADVSASGFVFYGQVALHQSPGDQQLRTLWYALPTGTAGVWSLNWNATADAREGKVLVTVKATAPAVPDH
ncbi:hypothetical protein F4779DRAFT_494459 [Xylariaceae sp. FL0662B]|nr:hypothetical protein F4779DRAFT_494459 [Xylariaceae sp. FL0662B]